MIFKLEDLTLREREINATPVSDDLGLKENAGLSQAAPQLAFGGQDQEKKSAGEKHTDESHVGDSHGEGDHKSEGDQQENHDAKGDHDTGDHDKDDQSSHDGDHGHGDEHGHDGHHGVVHTEDMTMGDKLSTNMDHFLDTGHLFEHVKDSDELHLPFGLHLKMPNVLGYTEEKPLVKIGEGISFKAQPTKFMALELVAAVVLVALFAGLAGRIRGGKQAKGRFWNLLEVFVVFIRDEIARPTIGKKDANKFLPFLLTTFFFVLALNLLGMIPSLGSATGSIAVTSVLAIATLLVVVGSGMKKMGVVGFLKAQVPSMDLPPALAFVLIPMIWVIEMFGLLVKHFVLAVRLFANMFAGHLVLAVLVAFIGVASGTALVFLVGPLAAAATVAFSLLELFVAFLQAYVFTFLAALFIGAAQHAH